MPLVVCAIFTRRGCVCRRAFGREPPPATKSGSHRIVKQNALCGNSYLLHVCAPCALNCRGCAARIFIISRFPDSRRRQTRATLDASRCHARVSRLCTRGVRNRNHGTTADTVNELHTVLYKKKRGPLSSGACSAQQSSQHTFISENSREWETRARSTRRSAQLYRSLTRSLAA